MTLTQLALAIQSKPESAPNLLEDFKAETKAIQDFIDSLKPLPVYIVPGLINVFTTKYREAEPKTLRDLMNGKNYIGALFADMDGVGWSYLGISVNGKPMCRPDNSMVVFELEASQKIKWLF